MLTFSPNVEAYMITKFSTLSLIKMVQTLHLTKVTNFLLRLLFWVNNNFFLMKIQSENMSPLYETSSSLTYSGAEDWEVKGGMKQLLHLMPN